MQRSQQRSVELMQEILGEGYQELRVERQLFEEDITGGASKIRADVRQPGADMVRTVEGEGVGIVDAFFHGLVEQFSVEYTSLKNLRFVGFSINGMLDRDRPTGDSGADAVGEALLIVESSEGRSFEFKASSKSITAAALQATLDAVEYFINSEMAFMMTRRALEDAKSRNRTDLVQVFSARLAELVQNTSYSEAVSAASG